jgi:hypothetical protein
MMCVSLLALEGSLAYENSDGDILTIIQRAAEEAARQTNRKIYSTFLFPCSANFFSKTDPLIRGNLAKRKYPKNNVMIPINR